MKIELRSGCGDEWSKPQDVDGEKIGGAEGEGGMSGTRRRRCSRGGDG